MLQVIDSLILIHFCSFIKNLDQKHLKTCGREWDHTIAYLHSLLTYWEIIACDELRMLVGSDLHWTQCNYYTGHEIRSSF